MRSMEIQCHVNIIGLDSNSKGIGHLHRGIWSDNSILEWRFAYCNKTVF